MVIKKILILVLAFFSVNSFTMVIKYKKREKSSQAIETPLQRRYEPGSCLSEIQFKADCINNEINQCCKDAKHCWTGIAVIYFIAVATVLFLDFGLRIHGDGLYGLFKKF